MLVLPAPAKINLYLHITGKRADGYHLLDTVFQLIDWHDTVTLKVRHDGQVRLHTPIAGLANAKHLAVRAALLMKAYAECALGADIWVEKRIPSGAGLGGGSSDAATTLIGLNQLWRCGLKSAQLQSLGLQLGADVPFFCSMYATAHAQGIGEALKPLPTQHKTFVVVYPDCHVSTPDVFRHPDLNWQANRTDHGLEPFNSAFAAGYGNDLQAPARQIAPPISDALAWLNHAPNCEGVRMSGSGSAVFAQFASDELARVALNVLETTVAAKAQSARPRSWTVVLARALGQHPVTAVQAGHGE